MSSARLGKPDYERIRGTQLTDNASLDVPTGINPCSKLSFVLYPTDHIKLELTTIWWKHLITKRSHSIFTKTTRLECGSCEYAAEPHPLPLAPDYDR